MSKEYNVKYEVGEEVYVLRNKKITKNRVDKIRVTEQQPYTKSNLDGTLTKMSGIEVDYLLETERIRIKQAAHCIISFVYIQNVHLTFLNMVRIHFKNK